MPFALRSFNPGLAACGLAAIVGAISPTPVLAESHPVDIVANYADALAKTNILLSGPAGRELAQRLLLLASYYRLDPRLLVALVSAESSWHVRAVSPVGARGYGQLMPATAASLDVDAGEPYENLDGTARYLRRLLNRFAQRDMLTRVRLALASYNAGPAAVDRYGGVPPYAETRAYVANVLHAWLGLVATIASPSPSDLMHLLSPSAPHPAAQTHAARVRKPEHARLLARHSAARTIPKPSLTPPAEAQVAHEPQIITQESPPTAAPEPRHGFFFRLFHRRETPVIEQGFASGTVVGP